MKVQHPISLLVDGDAFIAMIGSIGRVAPQARCATRLRQRTRLYAAAAKVKIQSTSRPPRWRSLRSRRDGLHPAEGLFDEFALAMTDRVAHMTRRPPVDRAAAVRVRSAPHAA